ncbi:MAG: valine--tRNA ligase [SAR202 cluster bacterium]|nr:valine--tRNA ligase [SAR202 cluster bacterium]
MTSTPHKDMAKAYDPQVTEGRIYDLWMNGGYFTPKIDKTRRPFVIVMPPPNVTGELHLGHALMAALEDIMIRWHRMQGEPTLYLPGTDHAGIATQVVVERTIAKDGLTRHDIGREQFIDRVWSWVKQYGNTIDGQLKRLGSSCDWSRKLFTLDDGPNKAVRTTFVNLYKKGLIYRGERINNWCSRCATALSDLEVTHQEEKSGLYFIKYCFTTGSDFITIATTRPETLLGDTAVAVNPNDKRYVHTIGKNVTVPIVGRNIPIIADDTVDMDFGTGALKVTPGHDHNDFEIGKRHGLPIINIMNLDGTLNENTGHYRDVEGLDARNNIIKELEDDGLLEKVESRQHSIGHCQRCNTVLEPLVSKQWYMKMAPLAKPAIEAVQDGRIKILPDHFTKVYFNWMQNIRDWAISRQLWWGHRIPVWYCTDCKELNVELEDPSSCQKCGSTNLTQDNDVLDTWFSSALWPHSTLGWPEKTNDLAYFHPTNVLETGHDILFFWVARMIMMGLENTGKVPFETVYLHGIVRDPEGVKMSKTKGNVMDPLNLIDDYGADALRFALTNGVATGADMRLNERKMVASRNLANKLWNATRFVLSNLDNNALVIDWQNGPSPEHLEDRWIISRLNHVSDETSHYLQNYQFSEAQRLLQDFFWGDYCDWYLELAKIRIRTEDNQSPLPVLVFVLERIVRLLHPFMPFITEEIWQTLRSKFKELESAAPALIVADYPKAQPTRYDAESEDQMNGVIELVRGLRNIRSEFNIATSQTIEAVINAPQIAETVEKEQKAIKILAQVDPLTLSERPGHAAKDEVSIVLAKGTVTIPLGGLVNLEHEKKRLSVELNELDGNVQRLSARLRDEKFTSRAPVEVVEREKQRLETAENRRSRVAETLARL